MEREPLLRYDAVAAWIGKTPGAVRRLVQLNEIPFVRVSDRSVRFDPAQIEQWLRERSYVPEG